jgi:hypothetical protein
MIERVNKTYVSTAQAALKEDMRFVWLQHVYWTRLLLISIAERLSDEADITARLLQNPGDIADVFAEYYTAPTANEVERLLTAHLEIGARYITALRDGKVAEADELDKSRYINADQIAQMLGETNPYWVYDDMQAMLYTHLDLTKEEIKQRFEKNYKGEIEIFGEVEREALAMADMLTFGVFKQYPRKFN